MGILPLSDRFLEFSEDLRLRTYSKCSGHVVIRRYISSTGLA